MKISVLPRFKKVVNKQILQKSIIAQSKQFLS